MGWILAILSIVLLFQVIISVSRAVERIWYNTLFISTFFTLQYSFILRMIMEYNPLSIVVLLLAIIMYLIPMIMIQLLLSRYPVISFSVSFLISELLFIKSPIGNQMFQIGVIISDEPILSQFLEYTGVWGGSLWIMLMAYFLFITFNGSKKMLLPCVFLFFMTIFNSFDLNSFKYDNNKRKVDITIMSLKEDSDIDSMMFIYNNTSDYLILPEAVKVIPKNAVEIDRFMTKLYRLSERTGSRIIAGIYTNQGDERYNEVYSINKRIDFLRGKKLLVPFAEYLPEVFNISTAINDIIPHPTISASNYSEIHNDGHVTYSPLICYEALFTEFVSEISRKGADLIFVSSSNTFVGSEHIESIIRKIIRANAIITRRNIVRASASGLSYFIDSYGRILAQCQNKSDFLRKIIEIGDTNSFYVKNREVVDSVYCCFLILLLFFVKNTHNKSLLLNLANLGFSWKFN